MLYYQGRDAKLEAGDRIVFDLSDRSICIVRDGSLLCHEDGEEAYYVIMPSEGVEFKALVSLVGDAAGLEAHELVNEEKILTYEFRLSS